MHAKRFYYPFIFIFVGLLAVITLVFAGKYFLFRKSSYALIACASFSPPAQISQTTNPALKQQLLALNQKIMTSTITPSLKPLLEKRKKLLITIMSQDPTLAKQYFLSETEKQKLGQLFSETCMEKASRLQGQLSVWHIDHFFSSQTFYSIKTSKGKIITLDLTSTPFLPLVSRMNISVQGIQLDNSILLDGKDLASITVIPQTNPNSGHFLEQTVEQSPSGPQKMLVVPVQLPGSSSFPMTNSQISNLIFTQMSNYYNAISFGKITITGDVASAITLPSLTDCSAPIFSQNEITTLSSTYNLSNYGYIAFIFNFAGVSTSNMPADCGNGTSGNGSIGKDVFGNLTLGVSEVPAQSMADGFAPLAHEFGHNLGLDHSNYDNCNGNPLSSSGCSVVEYGDHFDPMSTYNIVQGNANSNYATPALNAAHEDILGWFNPADLQTVTQSGSYTIEPIESSSTGMPKAIKIPRGNNDAVYVEYRQPIGVDSTLLSGSGGFLNGSNVFKGALIHILGSNKISTLLLTPQASQLELNAAFSQGSTFTDPATGVTVSVTSQTSSALTVQVTISTPLPTNPPAPTLTISSNAVMAGDTVTASWTNIPNPQAGDSVAISASNVTTISGATLYAFCTANGSSSGNCNTQLPNVPAGNYELHYIQTTSSGPLDLAHSAPFSIGTGVPPPAVSSTPTPTHSGTITVSPNILQIGQFSTVTWSNIPNASASDYIAIYPASVTNINGVTAIAQQSTSVCHPTPSSGSCSLSIPSGIPSGTYTIHYIEPNSANKDIAVSNTFTVGTGIPPAASSTPTPTFPAIISGVVTPNPSQGINPSGTPISTNATFAVALALPGIGNSPGDNPTPAHPMRSAAIVLINPQTHQVAGQAVGQVTYNNGVYTGTIQVNGVAAGSYEIALKMDNTLASPVSQQPIAVTTSGINQLPNVYLLSGDFNQDNVIDIQDYNTFLGCYGNKICSQKTAVDLNDDGTVNEVDLNILLHGIEIQQ